MSSQSLSRKRPAPGTSPVQYNGPFAQPLGYGYGGLDPLISDEQLNQYGYSNNLDQGRIGYNPSTNSLQQSDGHTGPGDTNQLARRPAAEIVMHEPTQPNSARSRKEDQVENAQQKLDSAWGEDLNDLKQRAQVAKRDAQSKRKQIAPFVQKLASFLDDGKNTNLIRWSDDGNSFIVEDEDEFAKKLIPEFFKHQNYASFVRQLNMYGFHKKVGLSDNSMRASEKKSKSPSEYSNPYFRRGHPDLLWLIQKPRNAPSRAKGSRKVDHENNEDDIDEYVDESHQSQARPFPAQARPQLAIDQGNIMPADQMASVHQELQTIRQQQSQITAMIKRLKREHEQLYGQAATFQDQHSRHENSINAILSFLASMYNNKIQGNDNVQGIANMFTNAIPQAANQSHVLDVDEYDLQQLNGTDGALLRQFKKAPLLLKAAPSDGSHIAPKSSGPISSPGEQPLPPSGLSQSNKNSNGHERSVEELLEIPRDQAHTSQRATPLESQSQQDMLSVIQNSNARNSRPETPSAAADFSNVLNSLQTSESGAGLTNTQRADMLRLIGDQGPSSATTGDGTLVMSAAPSTPNNYDSRLAATQSELENLAKMQADQDRSVQNLTNLLQPLSPSGSIPGLGDGTDVQPPGNLDIDDFLNNTPNYFPDFPSDSQYEFNDLNNNRSQPPPPPPPPAGEMNLADLHGGGDDDELFRDIGNNVTTIAIDPETSERTNKSPPYANNTSSNVYRDRIKGNNYNLNLDGAGGEGGADESRGIGSDGRVESMPSSSTVTTPTNESSPISATIEGEDSMLTTKSPLNAATTTNNNDYATQSDKFDDDRGPNRNHDQSRPVQKRKRVS